MPDDGTPVPHISRVALPTFYANADRGRSTCRIIGCDERIVRGITVCPRHEHEYTTGRWPKSMEGWQAFLADAGGDGRV